MAERVLTVWINELQIGQIEESGNIWRFRYSAAWCNADDQFALSPHLPVVDDVQTDGSSIRAVQWYFDNLLPEEGQRTLLAKDANIKVADAFGLLEYYGNESAGSLTILPEGQSPDDGGEWLALPDEVLEKRILNLPALALTQGAAKKMSLAGAQHKLAIAVRNNALYEPTRSLPSTHIIKPDHPDQDYPHSVINEWFVMTLAGKLGLPVPAVDRRYVPSPLYIVERFDRRSRDNNDRHERLHCIDACQLLGLDRTFKYVQGSVENLNNIVGFCRNPAVVRNQLFSWIVFNVLVGNTDAHLKNLSFIVSRDGIFLAPFYDLLSTACYETANFDKRSWPNNTELAWPLLNVRHFGDISRELLFDVAEELGIAQGTARRLLDYQVSRIVEQAHALLDATGKQNSALLESRPELGILFEGEMRCLRVIAHVIIRDMSTQLGAK